MILAYISSQVTATPSASVSLTTLPLGIPSYRNTNKTRKSGSTDPHSENNIPIFKGQKKLNVQLTRGISHTNYRYLESTKEPKSLALLRLLQLVLTETALKFRNMLYEQITERTMRRTCAQNYVIITVGKHEIKFLAISRLKPLKRWRYLDDIYMIWPNTLQELSSYLEALNSFHKNIRFVTEGSDTEANFFNVTVQKDNQGHIQTASYNPPQGSHLMNTFNTVLFSLTSETKFTRQPFLMIMWNESFCSRDTNLPL